MRKGDAFSHSQSRPQAVLENRGIGSRSVAFPLLLDSLIKLREELRRIAFGDLLRRFPFRSPRGPLQKMGFELRSSRALTIENQTQLSAQPPP